MPNGKQTPKESITVTTYYMRSDEETTFVAYDDHQWHSERGVRFMRRAGYVAGGDPQTGAWMGLLDESLAKLEAWAKAHEEGGVP